MFYVVKENLGSQEKMQLINCLSIDKVNQLMNNELIGLHP